VSCIVMYQRSQFRGHDSAPVGISEASKILVGFKEGGRGCLVTTKDFFGLYISFMDRVVILWMHTFVCSKVVDACTMKEFGSKVR
jgi:hypothetical protein